MRFVLITSAAQLKLIQDKSDNATKCQLENTTIYVDTNVAHGEKCVRCWHKLEEVGKDDNHPELCNRCIVTVESEIWVMVVVD